MPESLADYDRTWFVSCFRRLLSGWHRVLIETSSSCAVWEPREGIRLENFVSAGGKQCDGVTRMMPALAAWCVQPENPVSIELEDGTAVEPRQILRDAFVHGTDPEHPDYWGEPPSDRGNQRQVESSIVAWSLWLSRGWLIPELNSTEIANIQNWLAACTRYAAFANNWSLFVAVNHAARIALSDSGFAGEIDAVRRQLLVSDAVVMPDGWLWDTLGHGIDYYNFWVYGSHHCYLKAILPEYENPVLERSLERFAERERMLPYMIDACGQNILFGRSLSYRWGWLTGSVAAQFLDRSSLAPGLVRTMLGRNLERWLEIGSLNEQGVLRERLTAAGSDGGRDRYINCGHPYWGMQAFLCMALPSEHPFWSAPPERLPVEVDDFMVACQGPGLVAHGSRATGEVRLFNLRNLDNHRNALYSKLVYSTAFPVNAAGSGHRPLGDNQLWLRLPDGSRIGAAQVIALDVGNPGVLEVVVRYQSDAIDAVVRTAIEPDGPACRVRHRIDVYRAPEGAVWQEGGFALGLPDDETPEITRSNDRVRAVSHATNRCIETVREEGWEQLEIEPADAIEPPAPAQPADLDTVAPNIIHGRSVTALLCAPARSGRALLAARHTAERPSD